MLFDQQGRFRGEPDGTVRHEHRHPVTARQPGRDLQAGGGEADHARLGQHPISGRLHPPPGQLRGPDGGRDPSGQLLNDIPPPERRPGNSQLVEHISDHDLPINRYAGPGTVDHFPSPPFGGKTESVGLGLPAVEQAEVAPVKMLRSAGGQHGPLELPAPLLRRQ